MEAAGANEGAAEPAPAVPGPGFRVALLAAGAVLAASFANFLHYHGYPPLRAETGMVAAGLGVAAAAFAALHAAVGRFGRAVLEALLAFLAIDLNADANWPALLAAACVFLLSYRKRVSALPALAVLAGVVLATTVAGLGERRPALAKSAGRPAAAATQAPAILHIILDEHIGLAGIADPDARDALARFYTARGFRVYERAYSRHFHTVNAIPDILNFGGAGSSTSSRTHLRAGQTAYLSALRAQGYAVHAYESDFADFCSDVAYASCTRYWSPSLGFVADLPIAAREKARLIAFKFAGLSDLAVRLTRLYNAVAGKPGGPPRPGLDRWAISSSLGGLAAFDALTTDLRGARRGELYFAHLLVPHYPYVAASDCTILPPSRWEYRRSATPLASREAAYRRQMNCVMRKLDQALAALAASPASADAIVVVHGDHGSRITEVEPVADQAGRFTDRDLVAGFSTLFAVRGRGLASGLDPAPMAAPDLLGALTRSGFALADVPRRAGASRTVVLDDRDWRPRRRVPLPNAWQDATR